MHLLSKMRILMAEQDAGSGNGAAAPATAPAAAAPSESQATGTTSTVDVEAIKAEAARKARDAAFAEMRREGLLRNKPKKDKDDAPAPAEKSEPTAVDLVRRMRQFERAIGKYELGDRAIDRLEKMLDVERPDDIGEWVSSTLADMGIKPRGTSEVRVTEKPDSNPKTPTQPANAIPVTAAGGTPPPRADIEDSQIIGMSEADVEALRARKGNKWFVETLLKQARGKRVSLRR